MSPRQIIPQPALTHTRSHILAAKANMRGCKATDHGRGGFAFLESGWSVKDLGMTSFISCHEMKQSGSESKTLRAPAAPADHRL